MNPNRQPDRALSVNSPGSASVKAMARCGRRRIARADPAVQRLRWPRCSDVVVLRGEIDAVRQLRDPSASLVGAYAATMLDPAARTRCR